MVVPSFAAIQAFSAPEGRARIIAAVNCSTPPSWSQAA